LKKVGEGKKARKPVKVIGKKVLLAFRENLSKNGGEKG